MSNPPLVTIWAFEVPEREMMLALMPARMLSLRCLMIEFIFMAMVCCFMFVQIVVGENLLTRVSGTASCPFSTAWSLGDDFFKPMRLFYRSIMCIERCVWIMIL